MLKKIFVVTITALLVFALPGCEQSKYKKDTPEYQAERFFRLANKGQWDKAAQLTSDAQFLIPQQDNRSALDSGAMDKIKSLMKNFTFEIQENPTITDSAASVKVHYIGKNIGKLYYNGMAKAMTEHRKLNRVDNAGLEENQGKPSRENEPVKEFNYSNFLKKTLDEKPETLERTVTVQLEKTNDKWVIIPTNELFDVMTGDISQAQKDLQLKMDMGYE